jgi:hypothetical protein
VTAEQGCDGGSVTLNVTRNGATLFPSAQVPLAEDCGYELSFRAKERKGDRPKPRYVVEASFGGNDVFNPIANSGRFE